MAYPSNDAIQAAIIARLKANSSITTEVPATEIREDQWAGSNYSYPNIRVKMVRNMPDRIENCNRGTIDVWILVFTEDDSSRNADRIAGIINDVLHVTQFTEEGIQLALHTVNLVPAFRSEDNRTWQSEVRQNGSAARVG